MVGSAGDRRRHRPAAGPWPLPGPVRRRVRRGERRSDRCSEASSSSSSPGDGSSTSTSRSASSRSRSSPAQVPGHLTPCSPRHRLPRHRRPRARRRRASCSSRASAARPIAWGSATIIALGVAGVVLVGRLRPRGAARDRTGAAAPPVHDPDVLGREPRRLHRRLRHVRRDHLPAAFFQIVRGQSPTISGLQLLPLMAGLLIVSIGSGQVISRTGRYRVFPILGTALMTVGLLLLSRMGVGTSSVARRSPCSCSASDSAA